MFLKKLFKPCSEQCEACKMLREELQYFKELLRDVLFEKERLMKEFAVEPFEEQVEEEDRPEGYEEWGS